MKLRVILSLLVIVLVSSLTFQPLSMKISGTGTVVAKQPVTMDQAQKTLQQSKSCFIENKGQWDSRILYMGDTSFGRIAFTKQAVFYELTAKDPSQEKSHVVELAFQNSLTPTIQGLQPLSFYTNYFIGNDSSKWATHCKTYRSVTYKNIWEGIDMAYFFTPEGLKYEYYVHPGADISDLQVKLIGATPETLDSSRYLEMVTPLGSLKDDQLKVFTQTTKQTINASFSVQDDILSFTLENTKRTETIVVDPLLYATFLGGANDENCASLHVDPSGNAYVTGTTNSSEFPMTKTLGGDPIPGYDKDFNVTVNVFLVKLNPEGTELIYATFYGGSGVVYGTNVVGMVIDSQGCAYLTGNGPDDLPLTKTLSGGTIPGYDQTATLSNYVVKFNPEGTELVYATKLQGVSSYSLDVDSLGSVYLTGAIGSDTLPKTKTLGGSVVPGYDQTYHGGNSPQNSDGFVIKLNPEGSELVYATYLGGTENDYGFCIHVDENFNAYVAGETYGADFPMTKTVGGTPAPGYDQTMNGPYAAFIVKLNPEGTELTASTFLGGEASAFIFSMETDASGYLYVAGRTFSKDFPMTKTVGGEVAPGYNKKYFGTFSSQFQGFLVKFNPEITEQIYSTYLGTRNSQVYGLAVDPSGNVWVSGICNEAIPMTITLDGTDLAPGYLQTDPDPKDWSHVFVYQLNTLGTELRYASYFTGSSQEYPTYTYGIDLDSAGHLYVAGMTRSPDFPMTKEVGGDPAPGYDKEHAGLNESFIIKIENPYLGYNVTAAVKSGLGTVTPDTQLVKMGDNATITITPEKGYGIKAIYDNGQSMTVVTPYVITNVQEAHHVEVEFSVAYPELKIWAEVNKPTFYKNETVMLMVTIANQGSGEATGTRVIMTLPPELGFIRATRYQAIEQTSRMIAFEVGTIPGNSVQTFQVDASVNADVTHTRSLPIFFEITCAEKSSDSASVMIMLESKKSGDTSMYLSLYFRNAQWDPITSSLFITMNTPLELNFTLSGAQLPYILIMNWGDGANEKLTNQTEIAQILKHQFSSKGKMTMKFQVIDNLQQTRTATVTIEVR